MAEYTKIKTARTIICDFCNQLYSDEPCEPADCDWLRMLEEDAADVAPVQHGRWTMSSDRPDTIICSCCDSAFDVWKADIKRHHYCPNCGARMDGAE